MVPSPPTTVAVHRFASDQGSAPAGRREDAAEDPI